MKRGIVIGVAVVALAGASEASAAYYAGRAGDDTRVSLRTKPNGVPRLVEFGRYKLDCDRGYRRVRGFITGFIEPFRFASTERMADRGRGRAEGRGFNLYVRTQIEARHTPTDRWRGRFFARQEYRDDGDTITTCNTRFRFNIARRPPP